MNSAIACDQASCMECNQARGRQDFHVDSLRASAEHGSMQRTTQTSLQASVVSNYVVEIHDGRFVYGGRCTDLSTGEPFVKPRADATSTDMRIVCEDNFVAIVCSSALSRSPLLTDLHQVDADGWVPVPCHAKTWTAWLTDDPSGLPPDTAELMLDVIRVRSVYTQ
jgi:hypothetical protein